MELKEQFALKAIEQQADDALHILSQVQTGDDVLYGHLTEAKKALRTAISHINAAIDGEGK